MAYLPRGSLQVTPKYNYFLLYSTFTMVTNFEGFPCSGSACINSAAPEVSDHSCSSSRPFTLISPGIFTAFNSRRWGFGLKNSASCPKAKADISKKRSMGPVPLIVIIGVAAPKNIKYTDMVDQKVDFGT